MNKGVVTFCKSESFVAAVLKFCSKAVIVFPCTAVPALPTLVTSFVPLSLARLH